MTSCFFVVLKMTRADPCSTLHEASILYNIGRENYEVGYNLTKMRHSLLEESTAELKLCYYPLVSISNRLVLARWRFWNSFYCSRLVSPKACAASSPGIRMDHKSDHLHANDSTLARPHPGTASISNWLNPVGNFRVFAVASFWAILIYPISHTNRNEKWFSNVEILTCFFSSFCVLLYV